MALVPTALPAVLVFAQVAVGIAAPDAVEAVAMAAAEIVKAVALELAVGAAVTDVPQHVVLVVGALQTAGAAVIRTAGVLAEPVLVMALA